MSLVAHDKTNRYRASVAAKGGGGWAWLAVMSPLLAAALLVPCGVSAEGAVRQIECTVVRTCDARGECVPSSGEAAFRLEPIQTFADGSGRYTILYGESRAEAQAFSDAGPFVWNVGTERHALLASSETDFLWHRLSVDAHPEAEIRFMRCVFGQ
jgi:hypothetical protein